MIRGIDANDHALPLGSEITICNQLGQNDDTVLVLKNLAPTSADGNRILTPGAGMGGACSITRTSCRVADECMLGETCDPVVADYYIGPNECSTLRYVNPNPIDYPAYKAWVVEGHARFATAVLQQLQFYPPLITAPIQGTLDNYNPPGRNPYTCVPGSAGCGEAGNNQLVQSSTMIELTTVDAAGATLTGLAYTGSANHDGQGPVKILLNLGPGKITLVSGCGSSTSESKNTFCFGAPDNRRDVVLGAGQSVGLWHMRDTGYWLPINKRDYFFDERDVTIAAGLSINGQGALANGLQVTAAVGVYLGYGVTLPYVYMAALDVATSGPLSVGTDLIISGGSFTGGGLQKVASSGVPTVDHGTLDPDSTNFSGRIKAPGSTSSVTLTFGQGGFTTTSRCMAVPEGAGVVAIGLSVNPSASAAVFTCWGASTGAAVNCPSFSYECWGH